MINSRKAGHGSTILSLGDLCVFVVKFYSELLGDLFQSVALDDIANLVFIEISELAAALNPGPDLFHIVLEPAQSRHSAIINRLPLAQNPRSSGADDSAIGHITTRDRTL